jgi:hypothetical protein
MGSAAKRRTADEIDEAIHYAARLRDRSVPGSLVVSQLQMRFGFSRAQAYRTLAKANEQRSADGGLTPPPGQREVHQMLRFGLLECFLNGQQEGLSPKDLCKLSSEIRAIDKMGGIGEHRDEELQTQMVRQTYGRRGDPKGSANR